MAPKRVYGHLGRTCIQSALNRDLCTQDSFAAYLASLDLPVDRSLVARWSTGQDHVPADVLIHLAKHTGEPELVLGVLAGALDCVVVRLPQGLASGREITKAVLEVGAAVGRLQARVAEATDPDGDSGISVSQDEREGMHDQIRCLIQQLADMDTSLKPDAQARRSLA